MKKGYKPTETEEFLDLYFYRPIADFFLRFLYSSWITPNQISLIALIFGLSAGVLILFLGNPLYRFLSIGFLMISGILDCCDGQLARLRGETSTLGRIIDGFSDNCIFFSLYLFSAISLYETYGFSVWIWIILAGVSHSFQASFFDYYRNLYIDIVVPKEQYKSEKVDSQQILEEGKRIKKETGNIFHYFLFFLYFQYTQLQEKLNPKSFHDSFSLSTLSKEERERFQISYREKNFPLLRLWAWIGPTAHLSYIMIFIALNRIDWFFFFELSILNTILLFTKVHQNRVLKSLSVTFPK